MMVIMCILYSVGYLWKIETVLKTRWVKHDLAIDTVDQLRSSMIISDGTHENFVAFDPLEFRSSARPWKGT